MQEYSIHYIQERYVIVENREIPTSDSDLEEMTSNSQSFTGLEAEWSHFVLTAEFRDQKQKSHPE